MNRDAIKDEIRRIDKNYNKKFDEKKVDVYLKGDRVTIKTIIQLGNLFYLGKDMNLFTKLEEIEILNVKIDKRLWKMITILEKNEFFSYLTNHTRDKIIDIIVIALDKYLFGPYKVNSIRIQRETRLLAYNLIVRGVYKQLEQLDIMKDLERG